LRGRTETDHPGNTAEKPVKEMGSADTNTIRVDKIGTEAGKMGEVMGHIINEEHVIINIDTGKLYPATGENFIKGDNGPNKKG
jgi:hypothetical protein